MKTTLDLSKKRVLISRTDSIGDVILTLPVCSWLKRTFPDIYIVFLGKTYTKPVLECDSNIDEIVCWDDWEKESFKTQLEKLKQLNIDAFFHVFPNKKLAQLAKSAKIEYRIGTSHRLYHLLTCNIRPNFTRKNSNLHESQLNFELFKSFGVKNIPTLDEIIENSTSFASKSELNPFLIDVLHTSKKKVILHTKSQGSAVEWPIKNYIELAQKIAEKDIIVYFSGTEKEGQLFRDYLPDNENIIDISGKSSLGEFITFINSCDTLVACSTGPLHIAATLGKKAIGLYTNLRPIHPGRWAPLGKNVEVITIENDRPTLEDINVITVESVFLKIEN